MFLAIVAQVVVVIFGASLPATVTRRHSGRSGKGGTIYIIDYSYDGGRIGDQDVSLSHYQRLSPGTKVAVKSMAIAGRSFSLLVDPIGPTLHLLGFFALFNVLWNGIMFLFVYSLLILPSRRKWLVQNGVAASGRVTRKVRLSGRNGKTYTVKYQYIAANGSTYSGEIPVVSAAYQGIIESQELHVLYDPAKPKRSVAYELADYVCLDHNGVEVAGNVY